MTLPLEQSATRLVAAGKAIGILLGYMALVAGSFEAASQFTMPDSAALPFLTD